MTQVYVDLETLMSGPSRGAIDPDAVRALQFLAEAGHGVTIVGRDATARADLGGHPVVELGAVPERPDVRTWYLTADVARCRGRSAHLRTVLIGGASNGQVHRCDATARDVRSAVLEILAAEAMP